MTHPKQPNLFNQDIAPLHGIVFAVRLRLTKVKARVGHTSWLVRESARLTKMTEALLSGDPAMMRAANITPEQALAVAHRLTIAAGALARRTK